MAASELWHWQTSIPNQGVRLQSSMQNALKWVSGQEKWERKKFVSTYFYETVGHILGGETQQKQTLAMAGAQTV